MGINLGKKARIAENREFNPTEIWPSILEPIPPSPVQRTVKALWPLHRSEARSVGRRAALRYFLDLLKPLLLTLQKFI